MKGQVSIELLFLLGTTLFLLVPAVYFFLEESKTDDVEFTLYDMNQMGNTIIDHAESLMLGKSHVSWVTIHMDLPEQFRKIRIESSLAHNSSVMIMEFITDSGPVDLVFPTQINLYPSADFAYGIQRLKHGRNRLILKTSSPIGTRWPYVCMSVEKQAPCTPI